MSGQKSLIFLNAVYYFQTKGRNIIQDDEAKKLDFYLPIRKDSQVIRIRAV
jgi:hypothetical protein